MSVQALNEGDGKDVVGLYSNDADRKRADQAWSWRLGGQEWAVGARSETGLRGFMAATPCRVNIGGQSYSAAQIAGGGLMVASGDPDVDAEMLRDLVEQVRAAGVQLIFAAVSGDPVDLLQENGFTSAFEVFGRNLYVGLDKFSSRLSERALSPLRKFAMGARRMRPKLFDAPLDGGQISDLADLFALDDAQEGLRLVKDEAYLRWRYLSDPRTGYRVFSYRPRAGQGVSAFAVVRRFEPEGGRPILHVDEHWTRRDSRRDLVKLLGELALVALSEECDAIRCCAASGSATEQTLISIGCIRKKIDRHILLKDLTGELDLPDAFVTERVQLTSGDLSLYLT